MGTAIGSAIGGMFNLGTTALQNEYNKEQAALQNQYNIDMWNRQNEYNSPASQMNRLKEAGLNPNLMYGQGSTGNASSAPSQVAPQKQAPEMAKFGQLFDAISLMSSLEGLKKQRIENANARNMERQSFFEANLLEEYYRSRMMTSQSLFEQDFGPQTMGVVSVSKRASRPFRDYFDRPYFGLDMGINRPLYLAYKEGKNSYQTMLKNYEDLGYQVDMSDYRKRMLAKDWEWYTGNQWFDWITRGLSTVSSLFGPVGRFFGKKTSQKGDFHRPIVNNRYYVYH